MTQKLIFGLTLLMLAPSACLLGAGDGVGQSENHSTEQSNLYQALDEHGMRCEGSQGTVIDVASLAGRYTTEAGVGEQPADGSCRLKLRCAIDSYKYWPGGGVLRASLDEFSLAPGAYTSGLVHANGHALLAKHQGGTVVLQCTTPQSTDEALLDSIERSGLTCMTASGNSMLYVYEFAPDAESTLMWPENGGRCGYELVCKTSAGAFEIMLPQFEREDTVGPAGFVADEVQLRRGDDGVAEETVRCRAGRG